MNETEWIKQVTPWINKQAYKYAAVTKHMEYEDLYTIGQFAVVEGLRNYDDTKKTELKTHLMNMVKYRILRAITKNSHMNKSQSGMVYMLKSWLRKLGDEASVDEIYEHCQITYNKDSSYRLTKDQISVYLELSRVYNVSYDALLINSDDKSVQDKIHDGNQLTTEELYIQKEKQDILWKSIAKLKPRLQYILKARISDEKILDEIGQELNLTRERVRQLEKVALKVVTKLCNNKILNSSDKKQLADIQQSIPNVEKVKSKVKKTTTYKYNLPDMVRIEGPIMIYDNEFDLKPTEFKILQFLKMYNVNNKSYMAKCLNITPKSVYNNIGRLQELNIIDRDLNVLTGYHSDKLIDKERLSAKKPVIEKPPVLDRVNPMFNDLTTNVTMVQTIDGIFKIEAESHLGLEILDEASGKLRTVKESEIIKTF